MVTFWNQGAERQFGYKATDVTGRSFFMLFPDDDRYRVQNEIMEPLRDRDFHESEVRMRSRAGLEFPLCGGIEAGAMRGDPVGDRVQGGVTGREPWLAADLGGRPTVVATGARAER